MRILRIALLLGTVTLIHGDHLWPAFIPRCKLRTSLHDCILSVAQSVIPKIAKGIPEIGLRSLDPLQIDSISLSNSIGPVALNVYTDNITVSGQSNIEIMRIGFDEANSQLFIDGRHRKLKIRGNYFMEGSLLGIPLSTKGVLDLTIWNLTAYHAIKLSKNKQDGTHGKVTFRTYEVEFVNVYFYDKNLNHLANGFLNQITNDNWQLITRIFTPSLEAAVEKSFTEALAPFFTKFGLFQILPGIGKPIHRVFYDEPLFQPIYIW